MCQFTEEEKADIIITCRKFLSSNDNDLKKAKQALKRSIASAPGISKRSFLYKFFSRILEAVANGIV